MAAAGSFHRNYMVLCPTTEQLSLTKLFCIIQVIKSRRLEMNRACSRYEGGEVHTGFEWGNLREGHHLEDPD
jgi:hypothetical protein